MSEVEREFTNCPHCGYSVPPERVYTERKHFNACSLRCTRCLYQTETKATWLGAARFWNKARYVATASQFPSDQRGTPCS